MDDLLREKAEISLSRFLKQFIFERKLLFGMLKY